MKTRNLLLTLSFMVFMPTSIWAGERDVDIKQGAIAGQNTLSEKSIIPLCPQMDISANIGYGSLLNRTKGLTGAEKELENNLSSGLIWDVRFHNYFKGSWGLGAMYSGYHASTSIVQQRLLFDTSANFTYIAPEFCAKGYIGRTKLMLRSEIGIGYFRAKEMVSLSGLMVEATGSTIGYNCTVGLEYQLVKHFGIGLDVEGIFGSFNHLTDSQGNKYKDPSGKRMGASRINILLGLRYYIK